MSEATITLSDERQVFIDSKDTFTHVRIGHVGDCTTMSFMLDNEDAIAIAEAILMMVKESKDD